MDQSADVFSPTPELMHFVHDEIKTPLGVVVRQWPYWVPEACQQATKEEIVWMLKEEIRTLQ